MSTSLLQPLDPSLVTLFHFTWAPPTLRLIVETGGAKFVTVANRLNAPPKSVRRALARLLEMGLVTRNPGHGHPLRPEYLPTGRGRAVGRAWARLESYGAGKLPRTKWAVPLLVAVAKGHERFGELLESLPGLTPRALAMTLRSLHEQELLERNVDDGFPPRVSYRLAVSGLRAPLLRLAKETASHAQGIARRD